MASKDWRANRRLANLKFVVDTELSFIMQGHTRRTMPEIDLAKSQEGITALHRAMIEQCRNNDR